MKKMAFMAAAFLVAVCVLLTGCGKKLNGEDGKTLGVTHKEFVSLYNKKS